MLTFKRTFIKSIKIEYTNHRILICKYHSICQEGEEIAKFYFGENYSFIEFGKQKFTVMAEHDFFFVRSNARILNDYNDELIGCYKLPRSGVVNEAKFQLEDGTSYDWKEQMQPRRLFSTKKTDVYNFSLISGDDSIVYTGKINPAPAKGHNYDQTFEGEIQISNQALLLHAILGIYIMEEKFRRIEYGIEKNLPYGPTGT